MKLIDECSDVSWRLVAAVEVSIRFWQKVDVVKYEAVELMTGDDLLETGVHQRRLVEYLWQMLIR